jgi:hypothetical protein
VEVVMCGRSQGMAIEEKNKNASKKAKKSSRKKLSVLEVNTALNSASTTDPSPVIKATNSKSRDFQSDLVEYLSNWERKDSIPWKFNKVLQAWALTNVFEKEKINSAAFKQLCPYLKTVQGGAKTRLLEEANQILSKAESQIDGAEEEEGGVSEKVLKRAIKLKKLLED